MNDDLLQRLEDLRLIIVHKKTRETFYLAPVLTFDDRSSAASCALPAGIIKPGERQPMARNLSVKPRIARRQLDKWMTDDLARSSTTSFKIPLSFRGKDGTPIGISWIERLSPMASDGEVSYLLGAAHRGHGLGHRILAATIEFQRLVPTRTMSAAPYVDWYDDGERDAIFDLKNGTQTRRLSASEKLIRSMGMNGPLFVFEGGTPHGTRKKQRLVAGYNILAEQWMENPNRDQFEFYALRPLQRSYPQATSWKDVLQAAESGEASDWRRVANEMQWALVSTQHRNVVNTTFNTVWSPYPVKIAPAPPISFGQRTTAALPSSTSIIVISADDAWIVNQVTEYLRDQPSRVVRRNEKSLFHDTKMLHPSAVQTNEYVNAIRKAGYPIHAALDSSTYEMRAIAVLRALHPGNRRDRHQSIAVYPDNVAGGVPLIWGLDQRVRFAQTLAAAFEEQAMHREFGTLPGVYVKQLLPFPRRDALRHTLPDYYTDNVQITFETLTPRTIHANRPPRERPDISNVHRFILDTQETRSSMTLHELSRWDAGTTRTPGELAAAVHLSNMPAIAIRIEAKHGLPIAEVVTWSPPPPFDPTLDKRSLSRNFVYDILSHPESTPDELRNLEAHLGLLHPARETPRPLPINCSPQEFEARSIGDRLDFGSLSHSL